MKAPEPEPEPIVDNWDDDGWHNDGYTKPICKPKEVSEYACLFVFQLYISVRSN
jgi:hypothetical protein